jgi:DNA-binding NtrC family response regulator
MTGVLTGRRILVVEDDFFILSELEHILSEAGAEVIGARTIDEALNRVQHFNCSAAVLDFRIGRRTVTPVASLLTKRGIPFVFYTGQTASELAMTEWPDVGVIPKPSTPNVILSAVTRWLM